MAMALFVLFSCSKNDESVFEENAIEKIENANLKGNVADDVADSFENARFVDDRLVFETEEAFQRGIEQFINEEKAIENAAILKQMFPDFTSFNEHINGMEDEVYESIIERQDEAEIKSLFHIIPDVEEPGAMEALTIFDDDPISHVAGKSRSIQIANTVYHYYDNKVYLIPEAAYNTRAITNKEVASYLVNFPSEDLDFAAVVVSGCGDKEECKVNYASKRRMVGQIRTNHWLIVHFFKVNTKNQRKRFFIWWGSRTNQVRLTATVPFRYCSWPPAPDQLYAVDETKQNAKNIKKIMDWCFNFYCNWEPLPGTHSEHEVIRNGDTHYCENNL